MKTLCCAIFTCVLLTPADAGLISNGGFESGFAGWTTADQPLSEGTFFLHSGTMSPITALTVQAPPEGVNAAMTDAAGPGSHVLYQDFIVPDLVNAASVRFSLFINNTAGSFETPAHLDYATPDLNQQARVDIMAPAADPFSVASGDILRNLYQTQPGAPLLSGYTPFLIDVTSLLQAHQGQTLRLRFAEVDNVQVFNLGVDNVDIAEAIPEPGSWLLTASAFCLALAVKRMRSW